MAIQHHVKDCGWCHHFFRPNQADQRGLSPDDGADEELQPAFAAMPAENKRCARRNAAPD